MATSTPRGAEPVIDMGAYRNGDYEGNEPNEEKAKRLSTSSELTQVSTTDISSHGDDLDDEIIDPVALNINLQNHQKSIALSDIEVKMDSWLQDSQPPPPPTSPPPSLDDDEGTVFVSYPCVIK